MKMNQSVVQWCQRATKQVIVHGDIVALVLRGMIIQAPSSQHSTVSRALVKKNCLQKSGEVLPYLICTSDKTWKQKAELTLCVDFAKCSPNHNSEFACRERKQLV